MKKLTGFLTVVLTSSLYVVSAFAAEDHKAEALKHVEAAVESGKSGNASGVAEHSGAAKPHVDAANQEKPSTHFGEANKSLDSAIEHGKMGHADIAGKAAGDAATHLKMAP